MGKSIPKIVFFPFLLAVNVDMTAQIPYAMWYERRSRKVPSAEGPLAKRRFNCPSDTGIKLVLSLGPTIRNSKSCLQQKVPPHSERECEKLSDTRGATLPKTKSIFGVALRGNSALGAALLILDRSRKTLQNRFKH